MDQIMCSLYIHTYNKHYAHSFLLIYFNKELSHRGWRPYVQPG